MLMNVKSMSNQNRFPLEPAIYLNKAEASSLWTNDAFRERLLQLCAPQSAGIKRPRDMETAVLKLLNRLSPEPKRTLGHAGGLRR